MTDSLLWLWQIWANYMGTGSCKIADKIILQDYPVGRDKQCYNLGQNIMKQEQLEYNLEQNFKGKQ